jgi:hypothetical protein
LHRQSHGLREGRGGLQGPAQVAGVDGVQRLVGQRLRQALRLPAAVGVERDVGVALDARVGVPVGFAMADGDDAGGFQGEFLCSGGAQDCASNRRLRV